MKIVRTFLTGWGRLPFSDITAAEEDFLDDEQFDDRLDFREPFDWLVSPPEVTMPAAAPSSWICRKINACSAAAPPARRTRFTNYNSLRLKFME